MKLDYTVQIWREDEQYVAHAMPIDVASSGASPEEARRAVDEAVRALLRGAADHGTLEQVLGDAGYRKIDQEWCSSEWSGIEQRRVLTDVSR